jgi:hypothetical protein
MVVQSLDSLGDPEPRRVMFDILMLGSTMMMMSRGPLLNADHVIMCQVESCARQAEVQGSRYEIDLEYASLPFCLVPPFP